jgi:hypothetical protein
VNVAESWADNDPTEAASFALQLPAGVKQNAAAAAVSRWATQDPEAAMNWALKTGDQAIQTRALAEVLNLWASVDAVKAGNWVNDLPPGPLRELAIENYVGAVVAWEPAEALRVASTSSNGQVRVEQLERCLQRWMELDRPAAQKWIGASGLPQEIKNKWMAKNGGT